MSTERHLSIVEATAAYERRVLDLAEEAAKRRHPAGSGLCTFEGCDDHIDNVRYQMCAGHASFTYAEEELESYDDEV